MDIKRLIFGIVLLFGLTACVSVKPVSELVLVKPRDLVEQTRVGNGEGLAKPINGQPILVNNQLIFAAMGDAVLGIAMTIGTNNKTIALFDTMPPLALEQTINAWLEQKQHEPAWQAFLGRLRDTSQLLEIEPYGYLNGHPSANLQVRLRLSLKSNNETIETIELSEQSERFALEGEDSWSAENGQLLSQQFMQLLPLVFARVPESI